SRTTAPSLRTPTRSSSCTTPGVMSASGVTITCSSRTTPCCTSVSSGAWGTAGGAGCCPRGFRWSVMTTGYPSDGKPSAARAVNLLQVDPGTPMGFGNAASGHHSPVPVDELKAPAAADPPRKKASRPSYESAVKRRVTIDISGRAVAKIVVGLLALGVIGGFMERMRDVFVWILAAAFLAIALNPLVERLEPRLGRGPAPPGGLRGFLV